MARYHEEGTVKSYHWFHKKVDGKDIYVEKTIHHHDDPKWESPGERAYREDKELEAKVMSVAKKIVIGAAVVSLLLSPFTK